MTRPSGVEGGDAVPPLRPDVLLMDNSEGREHDLAGDRAAAEEQLKLVADEADQEGGEDE